jgi:hypothetical protein
MPVNPVTGERLPYPGDPGYMGPGNPNPGIEATNQAMGLGNGGPPMGPPMGGPMAGPEMGGQQNRLSQLLEAREMIDQEIAAIIGVPPGTENMDMLPPPPIDPMAQMPPGAMMGPGGPPMQGGPPGLPMPPMGPQGLLGM